MKQVLLCGIMGCASLAMTCKGLTEAAAMERFTYYVANEGNDQWSGMLPEPNTSKTDGPFASLERARAALRNADQKQARKVMIRGGVYPIEKTFVLSKEDSGTADHPVAWQAMPGEEVRLVGGVLLPPEAFAPVSDSAMTARLNATACDKIVQADLAKLGISVPAAFPSRFVGPPPVYEFFFNDRRMTLARWPNEEWATIAKIIDPGAEPRHGDHSGRLGIFEYSGDRPNRWDATTGVWLHGYWCFDWFDEVIQVKSIDCEKRQITLAEPHTYGIRQGNPSPRRYRAVNLLEELDQPDEYCVDRATGCLYFWPPAELAGARIVLATLGEPVLALRNASHVVLQGLIVEASQGDGIEVSDGTDNRIQACELRNLRKLGIRVIGGSNHRIEACDIHDTGTGGLFLEGGNRKTLTPAGHMAINNHIWRFSQLQLCLAAAIEIGGVGNKASHNLIHDAPHIAIYMRGNDHEFEYNVIHHVCLESDDCGAFGKGRNPSSRGNMIRHNFWHHIGAPRGFGNAAIYFDDGEGGEIVFGNVFFQCGEPGDGPFGAVFSHGGHDNLAENNVFIECKRAFGSYPWDDALWKRTVDGGEDCNWQYLLLQEVDITKPPYTTRYSNLVGFMNPQPGQPRINRAVRNVMVKCADVRSGNWQVNLDENWATDEDPGFVDMANSDFQLRPDAEVFQKLPGFQPIPFDRIGLYEDSLRPTLPQ